MLKILVVDDEPFILEGICELLRGNERWEVSKAASARQALAQLDTYRADIVVTDIRMPGMDGLALLEQVQARWPFCKVILLTAYSDFDYARDALAKGAFGYLLKTDGDAAILDEITRCEAEIRREMSEQTYYEESRRRASAAQPLLENAALLNVLEWMPYEAAKGELASNGIGLDLDAPLLLVAARIDEFPAGSNSHQRFGIMVQVEEIFAKYLSFRFTCYRASHADQRLVWILQEKQAGGKSLVYCKQMLEMVQENTRQALGVSLSIVYDEMIAFDQLHARYRMLLSILARIFIQGESHVLADSQFYASRGGAGKAAETGNYILELHALKTALAAGQAEEFGEVLRRLLYTGQNKTAATKLETYHAVCNIVLEHIESAGLEQEALARPEQLEIFYKYDGRATFHAELTRLVAQLIDEGRQLQTGRSEALIQSIDNHIGANLAGDLSLQSIADVFYMNPSYLSRFYKQHTGVPLGEAITAKRMDLAKRMLARGEIKISQIARDTGYDSAAYFTRVFKKREGLTPQEWRDKQ